MAQGMTKQSELMAAIYSLVDANPDIEKVKALTAETLKAKEPKPTISLDDVFYEYGTKTSTSRYKYICKLCGISVEGWEDRSPNCEQTVKHHQWHNALEERLRNFEDKPSPEPMPEDAPAATEEHHPRGDCYARAERSYTSQPHELNVNGPYGKFTRNP